MQIRFRHTLDRLPDDIREHSREVARVGARTVRDVARDGNRMGRRLARKSAGAHGRHYFKSFTAERRSRFMWEWGPDASMLQGSMAEGFEHGSINQPAHHDVAQAADKHGANDMLARLKRDLGPILR